MQLLLQATQSPCHQLGAHLAQKPNDVPCCSHDAGSRYGEELPMQQLNTKPSFDDLAITVIHIPNPQYPDCYKPSSRKTGFVLSPSSLQTSQPTTRASKPRAGKHKPRKLLCPSSTSFPRLLLPLMPSFALKQRHAKSKWITFPS